MKGSAPTPGKPLPPVLSEVQGTGQSKAYPSVGECQMTPKDRRIGRSLKTLSPASVIEATPEYRSAIIDRVGRHQKVLKQASSARRLPWVGWAPWSPRSAGG